MRRSRKGGRREKKGANIRNENRRQLVSHRRKNLAERKERKSTAKR